MKRIICAIALLLAISTAASAAVTIKLRRDTAANWTSNNPTLAAGEMGIETDTLKAKIGNGATAWTALGYATVTPEEAEPALGNPGTNGYVLSSTTEGVRSWVAAGGGVDEIVYLADCSTITSGACVDTDTGTLYYYDGSAVVAVSLGSTQPVSMQQVFSSSTTLVAGPGSKTKAITGVGWTTADIGCDASDTLGVSVKTASSVNGTYTEVGTVSLTASAQNTAVDISSWADISAGTWVQIDLTGTPAAATECTVVIEGVEQ